MTDLDIGDREPQPSDGPDYPAEHAAWAARDPGRRYPPADVSGVPFLPDREVGEKLTTDVAVSILENRPSPAVQELAAWWRDRSEDEIDAVVPKAIEYGANSMIEVGRSMARLNGRSEITDGEAIELACMFYIKGKLGRWLDAAVAGRAPSDDTIYDIGIYIKMAQRARDVGSWPGVEL